MDIRQKAKEVNIFIKDSIPYKDYIENRNALRKNEAYYKLYCDFIDKHMKVKSENINEYMGFEEEKAISWEYGRLILIEEIRNYISSRENLINELAKAQDIFSEGLEIDIY